MDISEKIKRIRENNNLTQQEFAKKLFVSRTAVSKWELKKGYPSIDSLKLISKEFNVSFDDLLTNNDVLDIAENDIREKKKKSNDTFIAILDLFPLLLFILPLFSQVTESETICLPLFSCGEIKTFKLILYLSLIALLFICAILKFINMRTENIKMDKVLFCGSFALSVIGIALFIECKQIYPSIFMLGLLVVKGYFAIKNK